MARLNIEDDLFKNNKWFDLLIKTGSIEVALGTLVKMWLSAQRYYLDFGYIPEAKWKEENLSDTLVVVGFVTHQEGVGYFAAGQDKQFAWLRQKSEAGRIGGIASGRKRLPTEEAGKRHGARILLNKAIALGQIKRGEFCIDCGSSENIEGHHDDYSKPYEPIWLCKKCHQQHHNIIEQAHAKRMLGERKAAASLPSLPLSPPLPLSPSLSPSLTQIQKKKKAPAVFFDGSKIQGSESILNRLQTRYPNINIQNAILDAEIWLIGNPDKPRKNIAAFLNNWLSKCKVEDNQPQQQTRQKTYRELSLERQVKKGGTNGTNTVL